MRFIALSLGLFALAGCAGREHPIPIGDYQSVPAPEVSSAAVIPPAAPADYRIGGFDTLRISVFGEPEMTFEQLPVTPGGSIQLPIIGEVQAKGRTADELSREVTAKLNRYLRDPQVTINVVAFASQKVTITGAVRNPGVYQTIDHMTLQEVVALGQGVSDYSKLNEVVVFRSQGEQRYVARFDLGAIQLGQAADPAILPGDTVVVGYSASRRLFSDSLAVLPAAVGIFIALLN